MKRIIYIIMAAAVLMTAASEAKAQMGKRDYVDIGWQFNGTVGGDFVRSAQGYGAYAEIGCYLAPELAVGTFISFNTNTEYFPTQTYTFSDNSALTTDLERSVYQIPFGATVRYRFMRTEVQPYAEAKVGAEYSTQSTYMSTFVNRHDNWGFYASPEVGVVVFPFERTDIGFQFAAYYSFASNRNRSYDIKGINNLGFKLGVAF